MNPKFIYQKAARYMNRWIMLPHRATESLQRVRALEAALLNGFSPDLPPPSAVSSDLPSPSTAPREDLPTTPNDIFRGYSAADLWVFDHFSHAEPTPEPGFVTDFLGTRTRTSSLWDSVRSLDGQIMGRPVPHDLFEAIEWIGLLKAVVSARDRRFVMMELGAGFGPWLAAGAVAARRRDLTDIRLLGVEADPGRFALMRQHFLDNGLDPAAHRLICAAVGVEAGHARWSRIADPANAGGARPVQETEGKLDRDDVEYMRGAVEDFIDVNIIPCDELLVQEPVWDLVHIDVQGWEGKLISGCDATLNERARWLVVGTHSRLIEGQVLECLARNGWILENEKPTRFRFSSDLPSLELMTDVDGVQVWRNPRLI